MRFRTSTQLFAPGATPWTLFQEELAIQITGPATAITATVQRSTLEPNTDGSGGNPAPVGAALSGNPATGMEPQLYDEPGQAWWRVLVTAMTGASVLIDLSGEKP